MKKIFHETVNHKLIEFLNELGYINFYQDLDGKESAEYYPEVEIDGYTFEVCVTIERCNNTFLIYKDKEYYGKKGSSTVECSIMRHPNSPNEKTLQELFDTWLDGYFKWLSDD